MAETTKAPGGGKVVPRSAAGVVRQRRGGTTTNSRARTAGGGTNSGGLWRFYTEDSTGLKIGPVPVLVMSLVFIASVFILHIWGKYSRSR
ncbi:Protein transport protein Sec61 subunit beta [Meloidogyne graminicola]|uniref:Protein transport protein Sec61 subunit beta n=1 Tax=Meloidogyne graminicola TaxID=189291 RepID=A0A8T0A174_9BILA|nr:Protein transport protein Sec61 subunit beta [Meloidogyne graminicola]